MHGEKKGCLEPLYVRGVDESPKNSQGKYLHCIFYFAPFVGKKSLVSSMSGVETPTTRGIH